MKFANPFPQPLPKECLKAAKIFQSFVDNSNNGLDGVIPREVLENAKGFAIFTIVKAGFVFSARAGSGVVIAKQDNGTWSAPSAIGLAGLGLGGQLGAEMTDFLIVLNSRSAIRSFMAAGSLTLGGNMSLAIGPLGRNSEAAGALNTNGKVAAMYSYSRSRGLFGGVSIEGSVIVERQDANVIAYNSQVTARLLLGGTIPPPPWASPLIKTLESCTGLPGNRQWVQDEGSRTPGGSYIFGGLSSPGGSQPGSGSSTPSFLRRKKKDSPGFPPASWGEEANTGSYFTESAPQSHSRNMTWGGPAYSGSASNSAQIAPASPFATQFESDYNYDSGRSSPPIKLRDERTSSTNSSSNPFSSMTGDNAYPFTAAPPPASNHLVHKRHSSPGNFDYSNRTLLDDDDTPDIYTPASTMPKPSTSPTRPFIKTRDELSRPLDPHEGVARAVALFDFNAVEDGDLSFKKGDVIIIITKSHSSDDWWTGKAAGRVGIFPANFVEVV